MLDPQTVSVAILALAVGTAFQLPKLADAVAARLRRQVATPAQLDRLAAAIERANQLMTAADERDERMSHPADLQPVH